MKRCGMPAVWLVCVVLGAVWVLVGNQQSAGQSPDEWRQLSLPDFVREITQLTSTAEPLSDALWTEIRSQSAERLLQAVAAGTGGRLRGPGEFVPVGPTGADAGANHDGPGRTGAAGQSSERVDV